MKRSDKLKRRKPSLFYKLLLPYLAILLITLVVGVTMFYTVGRQYIKETLSLRAEQLNQLALEVDYYFQYTVDTGDSILLNPKLPSVAQKNQLIYTSEDMRTDLQQADVQHFMAGLLVYLNNHGEFLTTGVVREAETYYTNYESLLGVSWADFRANYLETYHSRDFLPVQTLVKHEARSASVIPYVQSAPLRGGEGADPNAQIILFLDAAPVIRLMEDYAQATGSHLYLVDDAGRAAVQTAASPGVEAWGGVQGGQVAFDGEDHHAFTTALGSGMGQLVLYMPEGQLYGSWHTLIRMIAIMIAAFVCIGIFAAVGMARMNYRPIREINALLSDAEGSDEYERIKNAVLASVSDKEQLHGIIERQMPLVKESYLLRLLDGTAQSPSLPGGRWYPDVSLEGRVFYVVRCEFDTQTEFFTKEERLPDENLRCARIILENVGLEVLGKAFEAHYVNIGRVNAAFILSCPQGAMTPTAALDQLRKNCTFIQSFAASECGLTTSMGISTGRDSCHGLPQCQDEARHALEHALMMRRGGLQAYADLRPEETQAYFYYPADMDVRLASLLRGGSFDEAAALIESLYRVNFEERSISLHAGRCFVYEVGTTVDRVLMSLQPDDGREQEPLGELLRKLGGHISFAKAKQTTLDYVEKCRQLSGLRKLGQTEQLVERIAKYIDENVAENWLDLGSLAGEFKVTPQYISHIFKKYRNENIKDYISKQKLAEAKRYLRETDLTGEAISIRIGYASEAGLIRLFKKYESMTPNTYRQGCRKAN
ncbi:AraC family transcriptional regulator [Ruminococcaceae bacterium OttesenSCG-928-A11]|nr:AraC family transcriptional regulator [Ruminococcaceae bacterium OttesenSCG-928-A11]